MRPVYDVPVAGGRTLPLGPRTLVMGVVNVTPDSFSDGGACLSTEAAVARALDLAAEGADLIDIGGESTRPGSVPVTAVEERARVVPVIEAVARRTNLPISIDTTKAEVARAAIDAGAALVNDISGLRFDPDVAAVAAASGAGLVLMHMRGRSGDMYAHATYESVVDEVAGELQAAIGVAVAAGVARERLLLDPGLGFAKRAAHSLDLLSRLDAPVLRALDRPWLVGPSRKSFLTEATGPLLPADRDWATAAAVTAAILAGAHIVRVHRVKSMVEVVRVADAIAARRGNR